MDQDKPDHTQSANWIGILIFSIVLAAFSVAGAAVLYFSPSQGGFFPDLGKGLAWLLLGTANIICLLLNLMYLWLSRPGASGTSPAAPGRSRLKIIIGLQLIPALYVGTLIAQEILGNYAQNRAYEQEAAIRDAIERNDVQSYKQANEACDKRCQQFSTPARHLLQASQNRAYEIAQLLVSQGVKISAGQLASLSVPLRTCEDDFLPSVSTLAMAVANDDAKMLRLLLPASDSSAHREALWMAARLDRLGLLKMMEQAGLSLDIKGEIADSNETLLVAAASGAALNTGRWLLAKGMPVHALQSPGQTTGQSPFSALMEFAEETESPRIAPFLQLLIKHGADINVPRWDGLTWLQEAVRIDNQKMTRLLVNAGASHTNLTPEQLSRMRELLNRQETPHQPYQPDHCIPVS